MNYLDFVSAKLASAPPSGLTVPPSALTCESLFPHQRDLVLWALRRGRSAVFADTGLGKTLIELEWSAQVHSLTSRRVLIIAPLAVARQIEEEAARFSFSAAYSRVDSGEPVVVTNYEMAKHFDPAEFGGVVLDESSILKSIDGKTRQLLTEMFSATPYRLACTATPAPNDHTELGQHAEWLGVCTRAEMLSRYFVHDGGSTQNWRLKGHAEDPFWRWVCSWGAIVRSPEDLGHDGSLYELPPLRWHEHVVASDPKLAESLGMLFAPPALTLNEQRAARRSSMSARVECAASICESHEGPVVVWCELNAEADAVELATGGTQVKGADEPERKAALLHGFAHGDYRVLVTKPSIAGFGLNWQHCSRMVFIGASHSYEQTYQAVRRCWRFGQKSPVDAHVIVSRQDSAVLANYRRKERDAKKLARSMMKHTRDILRAEIDGASKEWTDYEPNRMMKLPAWLVSGEEN